MSAEEHRIREFILQLKLGRISRLPFIEKFGVDPFLEFADILSRHEKDGWLRIEGDEVILSREGLLRVDTLLEPFFLDVHRNARYA